MPTAAEITELRRGGELLLKTGAENPLAVFSSPTEVIAFVIYSLRMGGADEAEVLDAIELLIRATALPREEVREMRTTLQKLKYSADITKLLTALAKKARPAGEQPRASTYQAVTSTHAPQPGPGEAALGLALLRPRQR